MSENAIFHIVLFLVLGAMWVFLMFENRRLTDAEQDCRIARDKAMREAKVHEENYFARCKQLTEMRAEREHFRAERDQARLSLGDALRSLSTIHLEAAKGLDLQPPKETDLTP
jgi:hypothetical protein